MRVRTVGCVWVVCLMALPALAENEPVKAFASIGQAARILAGEVRIAAELADPAAVPSLEIRQVIRDGVELNRKGTFTVTYDAGDIVIQPGDAAKAPGTYLVRVAAKTPKMKAAEIVDLTLTRAAPKTKEPERAQFQIDSSLYIERVIYLPFLSSGLESQQWIVRETGGKVPMTPVPSNVVVPIFSKKSPDLGQLSIAFPTVQPSSGGVATLSIAGNRPWIGESNAKILLQSPSLKKNQIYTVVVRSRLSYLWLVLAIVAGVGVGWYVKRTLETRSGVLAAKLIARAEVEKALELERRFADIEVRAAFRAQRTLLERMIARAAATADEVKALTDKAKPKIDEIAKKAEEDRAAAKKQLNEIAQAIGAPEWQSTPLSNTVRETTSELAAQDRLLQDGQITRPRAALAKIESRLIRRIATDLPSWRAEVAAGVNRLGGWRELEKAVTAINAKLDAIAEPPKTLAELKTTLEATAAIVARLRTDIAGGIELVYSTVLYAIEKLGSTPALENAARGLSAARQPDLPRELEKVADAVQRAHDELTNAILVAQKKATPDATEPPDGLDTGDFRKAIASIVPSPAVAMMAVPMAPVSSSELELMALPQQEKIEVTPLDPLDENLPEVPTEDQIREQLSLVNGRRDAIYAVLIVIGGVIIFRSSFLGTLEDFAAAFLWGFSVDLTSSTLTSYASPLIGRKPFKAT